MLSRMISTSFLRSCYPACSTRLYSIQPVRIAYNVFGEQNDISGDNHPLIVMHGMFGSKQNWRGVSRAIEAKLKRRVYTIDLRNHGDSEHSPVHSSASMSEDLKEFMRQQGLTKAVVMGHSMGGRSAMYFALKYPELIDRGIIVDISPITIPRDFVVANTMFEAIKSVSLSPKLTLAQGRKEASEQIRDSVVDKETTDFIMLNLKKNPNGEFGWSMNVDALHKNLEGFSHYYEEISNLPPYNGPMTFICGSLSSFFDPDDWPQTQKIFPNSEIHWLEAGHLVHFDQPQAFIELVVKTLRN